MLKKYSAIVLGLEEFDEDVFLEEIEKILVRGKDELIFHFHDGQVINQKWESSARKDAWSEERREAWGEYQTGNKHAVGHKGRWLKNDGNEHS